MRHSPSTELDVLNLDQEAFGQCSHVCGNIKLITKNSEKGRREKGKKKGFQTSDQLFSAKI